MKQWRIIACESSDYRHIVHDDGFVWLMFVLEWTNIKLTKPWSALYVGYHETYMQ